MLVLHVTPLKKMSLSVAQTDCTIAAGRQAGRNNRYLLHRQKVKSAKPVPSCTHSKSALCKQVLINQNCEAQVSTVTMSHLVV